MPSLETTKPIIKEDAILPKKVQITDLSTSEKRNTDLELSKFHENDDEAVSSELHVVRYRKVRSAPIRSRDFYAQSSNLAFLQRECEKIERKMAKTAKTQLVKRPKIVPYKPFTWNSLAPYYNTDTLRYMLQMPVKIRRGYNTRTTASGLVDPEMSWKMDHCITPMTPSKPELFRQHFSKRRTRSAVPRLMTSNNFFHAPKFPRVVSATYSPTPSTTWKSSNNEVLRKN